MALYPVVKAKHAVLTTTTADLVLFTQPWDGLEISNTSGTGPLTVVFNDAVAPTALQAGSEIVMPGETKLFSPAAKNGAAVVGQVANPVHAVGIVGNGNGYSVVGVAGSARG